jgi:cytochrome c oxidase assembly factor CtaG
VPEGILQALYPLLIAALYARRARTLRRRGRPVPRHRRAFFAAGIVIVLLAVEPPLDGLDDIFLSVHMTQHILLGDLGPLLIVLGLTGPVLAPVLRIRELRWLRALANPALALPLWAVDLYVWHTPVLYQAAVEHSAVHALEHTCFLAFGIVMWLPVVGPLPVPAWFGGVARLIYVLGVRAVEMLLASVFMWAGTEIYRDYAVSAARHGLRPLTDQVIAGAAMMGECAVVTIVLFGWLFIDLMRRMEEREQLLEFAAERGVALSEQRAARAVAAGTGEHLRERLAAEGELTPRGPLPRTR